MSQFYVYYKVSAEHRAAAIEAATVLIKNVLDTTGVAGSLSCRADDALTLMESYPGVNEPTLFRAQLDEAVQRSGLRSVILAERHVEHFVPCA